MQRLRLALFCLAGALSLAVTACGDDSGNNTPDSGPPPAPDANTTPDANATPDASTTADAGTADAEQPDAYIAMSIFEIIPSAASRLVDTELTVLGNNIADGASLVLDNCDTGTSYDLSSSVTVAPDGKSLTAMLLADPTREQGVYTVTVTNPGGQSDFLECAFRILASEPPTVTDVVPSTAYRGVPGDGINSDTTVTITGTGFESTPNVRWIKTDASATYDALFVGYVSDTQITAVVPSETLSMLAGDYEVQVVNPDLLSAKWMVDDGGGGLTPGIFTITDIPPPDIVDVSPSRIQNGGTCTTTTITITGSGFDAMATVWYVVPAGVSCTGSIVDANGDTLCPVVVDGVDMTGNTITAHFGSCPTTGPYPFAVMNPDGQIDYYFSVEITPSSDGHLNTGAFEELPSQLETPRWRHATTYGFDPFGSAYLYVVGGQDDSGNVLGSVEISRLNVYGNPAPFAHAEQYQDVDNVRVPNNLLVPRQGATLVRVGRDLFSIGGADAATDVASTVPGSAVVERARILSYEEMPAIKLPTATGAAGLPEGTWYYQVSAVGPWGESLATREVVALNTGGEIEVCWDAPQAPGATSYNIYRSLASDGRTSSAAVIALEQAGPCFTDTGVDELTPAPGNLRGNVATGTNLIPGVYTYRVSATVMVGGSPFETYAGYPVDVELTDADVAAGNAALTLTWDPIPGATYNLYKLDDTSGDYVLLDGASGLTTETFTDDGAAFDGSGQTPRSEVRSLPHGSLSLWDDVGVPDLNIAREGVDGVVIALDPASSGGLIARILVAGGRTDNSGGAGTYLTTAESLGVYEDGTLDATWYDETPVFTYARAYFALVTTQLRNNTDFPPPPEEPPCGDLDGDGYIACNCAPPGTPPDQVDCDDTNPDIHPGATEICGDGIDQDCDMGCTGTDMPCACMDDVDSDTHISTACGGDDCCDDGTESSLGCNATTAPGINPDMTEICNDGIDQDCDGVDPPCACMDDLDGDGHLSMACGGDDCCDTGADVSLGCTDVTAPGIYPGAMDPCGDGIDQDCDGLDSICARSPSYSVSARPTQLSSAPTRNSSPLRTLELTPWTRPPGVIYDVIGTEPVYVVAVFGDSDLVPIDNNVGRDDFESCDVDQITGHLACDPTWTVQTLNDTKNNFGADALLYFSYLYPFYGVKNEDITVSPSTRTFQKSVINRYKLVPDLSAVTAGQILDSSQSASTTFQYDRSYYQLTRLMSFVYATGGWIDGYTDALGVTHPPGPTDIIERHQQ